MIRAPLETALEEELKNNGLILPNRMYQSKIIDKLIDLANIPPEAFFDIANTPTLYDIKFEFNNFYLTYTLEGSLKRVVRGEIDADDIIKNKRYDKERLIIWRDHLPEDAMSYNLLEELVFWLIIEEICW